MNAPTLTEYRHEQSRKIALALHEQARRRFTPYTERHGAMDATGGYNHAR